MEQTLYLIPRKMNSKNPVIILTVLAILARLGTYLFVVSENLYSLFSPVISYINNRLESGREIDIDWVFDRIEFLLKVEGGDTIWNIIFVTIVMLFDVLPMILLVLYIVCYFSKSKATVLLPVAFGALCIGKVISLCYSMIFYMVQIFEDGFDIGWVIECIIMSVIAVLMLAPYIIAFALLTVSSLKGFTMKPMSIVPCIVLLAGTIIMMPLAMFSGLITVIDALFSGHMEDYATVTAVFTLLATLLGSLVNIFLPIAVIILVAKNYVPELIPMKEEKLDALMQKKPEKALAILKMRYESGKISEEEYNARIGANESPESAEE